MPDCLLTMDKYDAFIACAEIEDSKTLIRNLSLLMKELPLYHKPILLKLLELLHFLQLPEHAIKNGLNIVGISIINSLNHFKYIL